MKTCKKCKHWDWTHNMWGDCKNPKVAKSPETAHENEDTCVLITAVPRSKQIFLSTLEFFGCNLFKIKK